MGAPGLRRGHGGPAPHAGWRARGAGPRVGPRRHRHAARPGRLDTGPAIAAAAGARRAGVRPASPRCRGTWRCWARRARPALPGRLLRPIDRDRSYSASPGVRARAGQGVLPEVREPWPVRGPVVGMGASLGGLAMVHIAVTRARDLAGGVQPVGLLLHGRHRRDGAEVPLLRPDRRLRRRSRRRSCATAGPSVAHDLRNGRGEPGQQPPAVPAAARRRGAGDPHRESRWAHLHGLARLPRPGADRPFARGLDVPDQRSGDG